MCTWFRSGVVWCWHALSGVRSKLHALLAMNKSVSDISVVFWLMYCFWMGLGFSLMAPDDEKISVFFTLNSFEEVCGQAEMFILLAQPSLWGCQSWGELVATLLVFGVGLSRADRWLDLVWERWIFFRTMDMFYLLCLFGSVCLVLVVFTFVVVMPYIFGCVSLLFGARPLFSGEHGSLLSVKVLANSR